jgi:hypothetical protein
VRSVARLFASYKKFVRRTGSSQILVILGCFHRKWREISTAVKAGLLNCKFNRRFTGWFR